MVGAGHRDTAPTMAALAEVFVQEKKYAEGEAYLRAALTAQDPKPSDSWRRYYNQAVLGASLAGAEKRQEAESVLLAAYRGMLQRETTIPAPDRFRVEQARQWIASLYEGWGNTQKAAEWRAPYRAGPAARAPKTP
jgi:hypothetical protein